ncbi:DMT family transporter [Aliiroseovarius sp. PrR006]|uniref:DMT family transporter n=1 Tax=Aliiroseovarius sp. PrR006 TaxID=2706883 RepID=UPI0013D76BD9|nr:DMT family transporter [Aliiroseovarius sp. PrR006]NDW52025.1 DMT family transporter [Aliiroseovarius sp. PrR006]
MTPNRGILLKLGSVAFFMSMQAMIKAASGHLPPGEIVFFRSVFALPVIAAWLAYEGRLHSALRTQQLWGHVSRGTVGVMAMGLNFTAVAYLTLPDITAILYASPIITVILAAIFLGEQVRAVRIGAVLAGLLGVLIIMWPQLQGWGEGDDLRAFGAMLALSAACFIAVAKILVRKLVGVDPPSTVVIYASFTAIVLSLLTLPFGWVWPTGPEFALLLAAGLAGGVGQLMLTTAYTHAEASTIAPFDYSSMIFALAFGYLIFGDLPTAQTLLGAGIVISAGLVIIWREAHLGKDRSKSRAAQAPSG